MNFITLFYKCVRLQTAIEIINYITCYCTENKRVDAYDLREVMEEIMDQEFETICEDESVKGEYDFLLLRCEVIQ